VSSILLKELTDVTATNECARNTHLNLNERKFYNCDIFLLLPFLINIQLVHSENPALIDSRISPSVQNYLNSKPRFEFLTVFGLGGENFFEEVKNGPKNSVTF